MRTFDVGVITRRPASCTAASWRTVGAGGTQRARQTMHGDARLVRRPLDAAARIVMDPLVPVLVRSAMSAPPAYSASNEPSSNGSRR